MLRSGGFAALNPRLRSMTASRSVRDGVSWDSSDTGSRRLGAWPGGIASIGGTSCRQISGKAGVRLEVGGRRVLRIERGVPGIQGHIISDCRPGLPDYLYRRTSALPRPRKRDHFDPSHSFIVRSRCRSYSVWNWVNKECREATTSSVTLAPEFE